MLKINSFTPRFLLLVLILVIALGLTATQIVLYIDLRTQLEATALTAARQQAEEATAALTTGIDQVMTVGEAVATELETGALPYDELTEQLSQVLGDFEALFGIAVTFTPFSYDPDLELYQVYVSRNRVGEIIVQEGATYNYTLPQNGDPDLPNTDWYLEPLANGAQWNDPFFATGAQQVLIEYAVPFHAVDDPDQIVGVVTLDFTLLGTRILLERLDLGARGYAYLTDRDGQFLANPISDYVLVESFASLAAADDNETLATLAEFTEAQEAFTISLEDPLVGGQAWMFSQPIISTGGMLGVVINQQDFAPSIRETLQAQMLMALTIGLSLWAFLSLVWRIDKGETHALVLSAATYTFICLGLVVLAWALKSQLGRDTPAAITSEAQITTALAATRPDAALLDETLPLEIIEIPTGIQIEAMDFDSPTSATLNGLVWQRLPANLPDDFIEGFRLPQRIGPESAIEEIYRAQQGTETIVIWSVDIVLRQDFDPQLFPFDARFIGMRLEPADLRGNVVLVPDLRGYDLIAPELKPGVDSEVFLYNWRLEGSFYHYERVVQNTHFALTSRLASPPLPTLNYTIILERRFIGPFIAYLLPGIIVSLMVYAYMLRDRDPGDENEIDNTLNYAAALFFVVVVSHAALRDNTAAVGITYMEYFYLLIYIGIITVALNDIVIAKRPQFLFVTFHNNLLPRLLFWPVVSTTILIVTALVFTSS